MVNRLDSLSRTCCFHSPLYTKLTALSRLASLSLSLSLKSRPLKQISPSFPSSTPLPLFRRSLVAAVPSTVADVRCRRRHRFFRCRRLDAHWSKRCRLPVLSTVADVGCRLRHRVFRCRRLIGRSGAVNRCRRITKISTALTKYLNMCQCLCLIQESLDCFVSILSMP